MPLELRQDFVEERHLVAADRAPIGRVKDEDHRLAAQVGPAAFARRELGPDGSSCTAAQTGIMNFARPGPVQRDG